MMLAHCTAFLVSPAFPGSVATSAMEGRVTCSRARTLQMSTGSVEERKKKMVEKAKSVMQRRAMMRPKKMYRAPITYPRLFTPELREAQKKLIDSPEMEAYMKSLMERGYMIEIKGKLMGGEVPAESQASANGDADE